MSRAVQRAKLPERFLRAALGIFNR